MEITSIQLSRPTKDRLTRLGNKGETYEDVINKLLDHWIETMEVKA